MNNKNLGKILEQITDNINNNNKGYLDLLYIIYNNMTILEGTNTEINKKIINSLNIILQNNKLRLKDINIDYDQELNKFTNKLYSIGDYN